MGHIVFGMIALVAGLCGVFVWWEDFGGVLRGLMPLAFVVLGLVALGAGLAERRRYHGAPFPPTARRGLGADPFAAEGHAGADTGEG